MYPHIMMATVTTNPITEVLHNNTDVDSSSIDGSNLDEENTFLPL
jgi:hypothetical protein